MQRSTKTKDKSQALQIAMAAERAARENATAQAAKRILYDLVERIHGDRVSDESVQDFFTRWLKRKRAVIGAASYDRYKKIIDSLDEFIDVEAPMSSILTADLSRWRDSVVSRLSTKSVNAYVSVVKQAISDAFSDGVIPKNPAASLQRLKTSKRSVRRAFTMEEIERILEHAAGEWRGITLVGIYSAQRLADIVTMKKREVGKDGWWRRGSRKTGYEIAVPLPACVLRIVRAAKGDFVFPHSAQRYSDSGEKTNRLSEDFRRIMVSAGLAPARDHKRRESNAPGRDGRREISEISFHSLRHTTTTLLKTAGASESVAMAFVGHESRSINRQYTHMPEDALSQAAAKLPDFSKVISINAA